MDEVGITYEEYGRLLVRTWNYITNLPQSGFYVDALGPDHIYGYSQGSGYFGWFQVRPGSYVISCSASGYYDQEKTVNVYANQDTRVEIYMVQVENPNLNWISLPRLAPFKETYAVGDYYGVSLDYIKETAQDVTLSFRVFLVYQGTEYFRTGDNWSCTTRMTGPAGALTGSCDPKVLMPSDWNNGETTDIDIGLDMKINSDTFLNVGYWPQAFTVAGAPSLDWVRLDYVEPVFLPDMLP